MKKEIRIQDALGNLEHELNTVDALTFMLWEKAHYFLELCEDAGKAVTRAQQEYKDLCAALSPESAINENDIRQSCSPCLFYVWPLYAGSQQSVKS